MSDPKPRHIERLIVAVIVIALFGAVASFAYSAGVGSVTSQFANLESRLTRANHTQNNLSVAIKLVAGTTVKQARVNACRQHVSDFQKVMADNEDHLLVTYIGLVVHKPTGVDLATNAFDNAVYNAYQQASDDYRTSVVHPMVCK